MFAGPQEQRPSLYEPLSGFPREFRLLILEPCLESEQPISCTLSRETLDSSPDYEALSYTWGSPVNEAEITINLCALPVRRNLWDALHHLRKSTPRSLWIDAVCIDQDNILERNEQVRIMRQIYGKAQKVLVWLGLEYDGSNLALDFMRFISRDRRKRAIRSEKLDGAVKYSGYQEELQAVRNLCQRPYWERLWIVQEVVVSQTAELCCGRGRLWWDDFSRFQKCVEDGEIEMNSDDSLQKSLAFNLDRYRTYQETDYSNLIELLEAFSSSLCFEIRDKVYGLVGLAADAAEIQIDYARQLYDIFVDIIRLQDKEDCALLMACSQFVQALLGGEVGKSAYEEDVTPHRLIGLLGYETAVVAYQSLEDWGREAAVISQLDKNGQLTKRMHVASRKLSHGIHGGRTWKEYKQSRLSSVTGRDRNPTKLDPWGQLQPPIKLEQPGIKPSREPILRCFIDSRSYVGVTACDVQCCDKIWQFGGSDVVAILRWSEHLLCYTLLGGAVFPKRENESDVPFLMDTRESFQFSVPAKEECVKLVTLWLSPYDLQRLSQ